MKIIHYIVLICQLSFSSSWSTLGLIHCRRQVQKLVGDKQDSFGESIQILCETVIHRTVESDIGRQTDSFANSRQGRSLKFDIASIKTSSGKQIWGTFKFLHHRDRNGKKNAL